MLENVLDPDYCTAKIENCEQSSGPPACKHTPPLSPAPPWAGEIDKSWKQVLVGLILWATRNMKYIKNNKKCKLKRQTYNKTKRKLITTTNCFINANVNGQEPVPGKLKSYYCWCTGHLRMHDSWFCNLSTKTTINVIEYSIDKIIFCLSILVMLGKIFSPRTINAFGLKGFLSLMMFYCDKSHRKFKILNTFNELLCYFQLCIKTFHRVLETVILRK